ncbi:MAG TPA: hypothetical protein PLJ27_26315 [Polyangiaceae bacterium]|nr:MAG: hypothetical protein BWY17_03858 [Deltaproteobacteria bacterium ADurb.Bin207]HNS98865.1 hypothetical protein [Polyangiaceae bacterium]HNZ22107.1 hypothetical protein [Polyangiaceae bacterium]HOD21397.1 hypothetical protein [Polyangiaceae bacterium]HOE51403.1 hypothetical protein [Polyangiaceae bacterium]
MAADTRIDVAVTHHFATRAAQRGLSPRLLHFILSYGTEFPAHGAVSFTVRARDLPDDLRDLPEVELAKDWIVVMAENTLITCYHRPRASAFLRRKNKLPSWARPCRTDALRS